MLTKKIHSSVSEIYCLFSESGCEEGLPDQLFFEDLQTFFKITCTHKSVRKIFEQIIKYIESYAHGIDIMNLV